MLFMSPFVQQTFATFRLHRHTVCREIFGTVAKVAALFVSSEGDDLKVVLDFLQLGSGDKKEAPSSFCVSNSKANRLSE